MRNLLPFYFVSFLLTAQAQFAPAVGISGTTAMYKDSSVFVSWATKCSVQRGLQDISNPSLGFASVGDSSLACGIALSNGVVSLGDGGVATLQFDSPIYDGPGYDFAVFENAFNDTFLEFAFVEISSDGINFYRIPAQCLASQTAQIGSFDSSQTILYHNLAGKYRAGYGTPFDINDISNGVFLNKQAVTHVRVIDAIGSLNSSYATFDINGNKINDPFPTPFPSSGFDLDAIGVIHIVNTNSFEHENVNTVKCYPNPCLSNETFTIEGLNPSLIEIFDMSGMQVYSEKTHNPFITLKGFAPGIYNIRISNKKNNTYLKIVFL